MRRGRGNGSLAEAPAKRGPGRPRKYPRPDEMEAEAPPKRGPGRPPKSESAERGLSAPGAADKRQVGRRGAGGKLLEIDAKQLVVQPSSMTLTIEGLTPLLVHNFGAKAIKSILDKQTGQARTMREKKDPFRDFVESLYVINQKRVPKKKIEPGDSWPYVADTFGFPASAFKKAMVQACGFVDGISKTWIRGLVHIHGDLLPIKYKRLVMRQDTVRVGPFGKKTADIRFRGEFQEWSIPLRVSFNANAITPQQIVMLLNNAGFSVGVGEWRPEKDGSSGTFAVTSRK